MNMFNLIPTICELELEDGCEGACYGCKGCRGDRIVEK